MADFLYGLLGIMFTVVSESSFQIFLPFYERKTNSSQDSK